MQRTLVTFSFTLILKVRVLDSTKLLRNIERLENKDSLVNCLITYMFAGLEHKKNNKVQVP